MKTAYAAGFMLILSVLLFLPIFLLLQPFLYHHLFQPAFYFDRHFLHDHLIYPGGLVDMLADFFQQFFFVNVAGALLLTFILAIILLLHIKIIKKTTPGAPAIFFATIPVALLYWQLASYNLPPVIILKYLLVLLSAFIFVKIPLKFRLFFLLLMPLFYYLLGGWTFLFMTVLLATLTLLQSQSRLALGLAVALIISYGIWPFLAARFFFLIPMREAFSYIAPSEFHYAPVLFKPALLFFFFFSALPLLLGVGRLGEFFVAKIPRARKMPRLFSWPYLSPILALLGLGLVIYFSDQPQQRRNIYIDYLAETRQWDKLLAEAKQVQVYDRMIEFNVNRALYYTGRLLDDLFNYNHAAGVNGLFIDREMAGQIALPASDLYFDLAHINAAQVMAYEAQTKQRYNPRILKRLALTNIINGHAERAAGFMRMLEKSWVHKSWARRHQLLLDEKNFSRDAELMEKRQFKPTTDFFINSKNPTNDLLGLLEYNSGNRMAFEYLMACCMLEGRMTSLARHLDIGRQFGYPTMPRHLGEAALMYQSGAQRFGQEPLRNVSFPPETLDRFAQFNRIIVDNQADRARVMSLLRQRFGNTFWYYVFSGGATRTDSLKKKKIEESLF